MEKGFESAEDIIEKFKRTESEPLEIIKTDLLIDANVEIKMMITVNRWPNPMGKDRLPLLNLVGDQLTRKGWLNERGEVIKPFGLLAEGEFIPITATPPFDLNSDGAYTGVFISGTG